MIQVSQNEESQPPDVEPMYQKVPKNQKTQFFFSVPSSPSARTHPSSPGLARHSIQSQVFPPLNLLILRVTAIQDLDCSILLTTMDGHPLSLHTDIWLLISDLLSDNETLRLIGCGSRALNSRLRARTQVLSLVWKSVRYMDLSLVFSQAAQFERLTRFEFRSLHAGQRFWSPVNWSLLPPSLEHLSLRFYDCLGEVLALPVLGERWPSLQTLNLAELISPCQTVARTHRPIDLRRLPSTLLELRLASTLHKICFRASHLRRLPTGLQVLELNFLPLGLEESELGEDDDGPMIVDLETLFEDYKALDRLPSDLQRLLIRSDGRNAWNMDPKTLPNSLREFVISDTGGGLNFLLDHEYMHNEWDFTGCKDLLPNLHTLIAPIALVPSDETAQTIFPESLTHLEINILQSGERLHFVPEHALKVLRSAFEALRLLSPRHFLSIAPLESAVLFRDYGDKLPSTIKTLSCQRYGHFKAPEALEKLSLYNLMQHPAEWEWTDVWGSRLRQLELNVPCKLRLSLIQGLPDTLERFSADIPPLFWQALMDRMHSGGQNCLPRLVDIHNRGPMPWQSLLNLPERITVLGMENVSSADFNLEEASSSESEYALNHTLKNLTLKLATYYSDVGALFAFLMGRLQGLETIDARINWVLSPLMKITWPPRLRRMKYRYESGYLGNPKNGLLNNSEPLYKLPDSLVDLTLVNMTSLPKEYLPSHLSVLNILVATSNKESEEYFKSRQPPSHLPNSTLQWQN